MLFIRIVAMISLLYLLLVFLSRWVKISTSKSQVEIPCIKCKTSCNGSYVHDVRLLKIKWLPKFLLSHQMKIVPI